MTSKISDLVVTTGSYTNRDGIEKRQYETIGALWQNDKGQFITLKKTFNPAGIASDRDTIMVSLFEPRQKDSAAPQRQAKKSDDFGDQDLPF